MSEPDEWQLLYKLLTPEPAEPPPYGKQLVRPELGGIQGRRDWVFARAIMRLGLWGKGRRSKSMLMCSCCAQPVARELFSRNTPSGRPSRVCNLCKAMTKADRRLLRQALTQTRPEL